MNNRRRKASEDYNHLGRVACGKPLQAADHHGDIADLILGVSRTLQLIAEKTAKLQETANLQNDYPRLEEDNAKLTEKSTKFEKENEILHEKIAGLRRLNEDNTKLTEENAELKNEIERLENSINVLQGKLDALRRSVAIFTEDAKPQL